MRTGSHASDGSDRFGSSVAASADGKTIVVGADLDEIPGSSSSSGVVYVFDRVENNFNEVGILTGSHASDGSDRFGGSVATSADGKTIIVGAYVDEIPGSGSGSGVVYVFDRVENNFNEVGILTGTYASDSNDKFGYSVATSADGKTIIVGASDDEIPGSGSTSGVVYVFDREGNNFNQVGILTGSYASDSPDSFGDSVATSADGKTIVVGASSDEIPGSGSYSGVVYVFDRVGNNFNEVGILTGTYASDGNDQFGDSVATSADGKTIIVGAYSDEISGSGMTPSDSGLVYVFDRVGNNFNEVAIFTGSHASSSYDYFGYSVATSADGKTIVVGARDDEIPGSGSSSGVTYVFDQERETYVFSDANGNIGIGSAQPTAKLDVDGNITATSFSGGGNNIVHSTWTLGENSSIHWTFTGPGGLSNTDDPKIYLARGQTYEFVNNSGGSHPFQIQQSNGSAYSTGVTYPGGGSSASSGTIRFEVPFDAPNTLQYKCTSHSDMGNTIIIYPDLSP